MTIRELLRASTLNPLDAEVILAHVLGQNRAWLTAHSNEEVKDFEAEDFRDLVECRKRGEPVAYITGTKEFYGRQFIVTPATLIPRPSTEALTECTLVFLESPKLIQKDADTGIVILGIPFRDVKPDVIIDAGTGSGILPITLRLEGRKEELIGVDISPEALAVAEKNAATYDADVAWIEADGAQYVQGFQKPFLVISNPPYIPEGTKLPKDVKDYEPHEALFAGPKGLDVLLPLVTAAKENPQCTGILLECRDDQVEAVLTQST